MNFSYIEGAFTNILTHTNICSLRQTNQRHAAQQSILTANINCANRAIKYRTEKSLLKRAWKELNSVNHSNYLEWQLALRSFYISFHDEVVTHCVQWNHIAGWVTHRPEKYCRKRGGPIPSSGWFRFEMMLTSLYTFNPNGCPSPWGARQGLWDSYWIINTTMSLLPRPDYFAAPHSRTGLVFPGLVSCTG